MHEGADAFSWLSVARGDDQFDEEFLLALAVETIKGAENKHVYAIHMISHDIVSL